MSIPCVLRNKMHSQKMKIFHCTTTNSALILTKSPFCPQPGPTPLVSSPPVFQTLAPSSFLRPKITISSPSSPMAAAADLTAPSTETKPFAVLFVCLGNICRSPAAEGVFREFVKRRGIESKFEIDSAGTINYHQGNPADSRMISSAKKRGIEITSISRRIKPSDFVDFDLILAMDKQNKSDILEAFDAWKGKFKLPADASKKVKLMCSYCKKHKVIEVPDPYYDGPSGFEKVLDLLDDACESLLDDIVTGNPH